MKLLVAYTKGSKYLLKLGMDDGTEKWATTTSAVVDYAKKNFQMPCEAKFEMTEKNGQYHVSRVYKPGESASAPVQTAKDDGKPKCELCGKELKDSKYKKCYECNKKASESKTGTYSKSPEDKEQIKRLSVLSSASNAVSTAMQGQLGDAGALADMIIAVYEKLYKKVSE